MLWPSLLDSDVELPELQTHHEVVEALTLSLTLTLTPSLSLCLTLTHHEALPVEAGVKFGANLWIHQYDFRTPSSRRCELTCKNSH